MKSNLAIKRTEAELQAEIAQAERANLIDNQRSIEARRDLETGMDIEPAVQTRHKLKPARRLSPPDGLDTLKAKLTPEQYHAGRKFEGFWRTLHKGDLQSGLAAMEVRSSTAYSLTEAQSYARSKLKMAAQLLNHHPGMWQALTLVCGEGKRPSEATSTRRDAERLEARLDCALTILTKL